MPLIPLRDGEHLHVRCIGHGAPVVLLHGFGSQSSHWLPNVLPLARRYRFILPDLRGFGPSHHASLAGRDVFTTYAEDLDDVLDHLRLDQVMLGGISTGAYACLAFNQGGGFRRVSRYLNIEHSAQSRNCSEWRHGLFGERQDEIFAEFRALLQAVEAIGADTPYWSLPTPLRLRLRDTVAALFHRALHRPAARLVVRLAARYAERLLTRYLIRVENWQAYLQVMVAFMEGRDTRDQLTAIRVPTTLMIGMRSRFFSAEGQMDICRYVPQAKVVRFEHSGHIPIVDEPLKFQREFAAFLRGA
jgi:pimeloyl-ACP methyl ester carboxylesterase